MLLSMHRVLTLTVGQSTDALIRTEVLAGRQYTVVPVIAIVEGVLQGANSSAPEFAPAIEFGKYPDAWNGRPVVLRHPQIQGIFVSANHPQVFEDYHMGFMFNTVLDGKKLKTESWLDETRIGELGGDYQQTLERLQAGETINVSVGVFLDTRAESGVYNGRQYASRWENIVPDHLALLPDEIGACSVADGCGTNRVASALAAFASNGEVRIVGPASCCESCAKGEGCMADVHNHQQTPPTEPGEHPAPAPTPTEPAPTPTEPPAQQPGHGEPANPPSDLPLAASSGEGTEEVTPEVLAAQANVGRQAIEVLQGLTTAALGNTVELSDAMRIVRDALPAHLGMESWAVDLMAMTADVAVFYAWGEPSFRGFHQIRYSVTDQGAVSFTGDPEPVNLMTKIMPRQTGVSANSGQSNSTEDGDMAIEGQGGNNPAAPAATEGQEGTGQQPAAQPQVNAAPSPRTLDQFLTDAPPEIGAVLRDAIRNQENRKTHLIGVIKANSRNKLSDEQLGAMPLDQLENIAAFAAPEPVTEQPSYLGRPIGELDSLSVNSPTPAAPVSTFMDIDQDYLMAQPAGNA